jgi:hypothetical protein
LGLTGTNLWVHSSPDHDANLARFNADPSAPMPFVLITSIRNLYLTGQDVCRLGVTMAMMGGVLTASAVLGRSLMSVVSKPD